MKIAKRKALKKNRLKNYFFCAIDPRNVKNEQLQGRTRDILSPQHFQALLSLSFGARRSAFPPRRPPRTHTDIFPPGGRLQPARPVPVFFLKKNHSWIYGAQIFFYLIPPTYSAVLEALTLLSASQSVLLGKNWFSQRVGRPDSTRDSTSRFTNGSSGLPV